MSRTDDLASFGRRIADSLGQDGSRGDVNWAAYGQAAETAMGRGRKLPDVDRYVVHTGRGAAVAAPPPPPPPEPEPAPERRQSRLEWLFATEPAVRPRLRWHRAFGGHSLEARGWRAHTRRDREIGIAAVIEDPSGRDVWSGRFGSEHQAQSAVEQELRRRHAGEYRRRGRERSRQLRRAGVR